MPNIPLPKVGIVVGGFVNGLGIVRALSSIGIPLVVITTASYDIAQYSTHVIEHYHLPNLHKRPDILFQLLTHRSKDWSGAVIFPSTDTAIDALSKFYAQLSKCYRIICPPLNSVPYMLNKSLMLRAASAVGMRLPVCFGPAAAVTAKQDLMTYPVVIKPVNAGEFSSRFGRKLFIANNKEDMVAYTQLLAETNIEGMVFEWIPGPDANIYACCVYIDAKGRLLADCTIHKLRQSPPLFGIARLAECAPTLPVIKEQTIEFLKFIGYRGIAVAEFKRDERDGLFKFFEVNGRSVVYNNLLKRCGMDVAKLVWMDYIVGQARPVPTRYWNGVWVHLHADILRSLENFRSEQISLTDYLRPYCRRKTFAVWSRRDPKPFFAQWSHTAGDALKAISCGTFSDIINSSQSSAIPPNMILRNHR